jgi:predicted NUDIX family NTP pyrophosphohydrolase
MSLKSAGLLMYRKHTDAFEFFLIHPGGPFWIKKNEGAWSIPKGLSGNDEELLATAQREFTEETGIKSSPPFYPLGSAKLKSGKTIFAWAFEGAWNPDDGIVSNFIEIEWPPCSKKFISVTETDRAEWMAYEKAAVMINPGQLPLLKRALEFLT